MMSSVGFKDPLYFIGVVEDVSTNNALPGRVKVRAFGIHPPVANSGDGLGFDQGADVVPTDALPWAPMINGTSGSVSKMPELSDWVLGMFIDGRDAQHPIILGTIPGIKGTLPANSGTDYDNDYEIASNEAIDKFNKPVGGAAAEWSGVETAPVMTAMALSKSEPAKTSDERDITQLPIVAAEGTPDKLTVIKSTDDGSSITIGGNGDTEHIAMIHNTGAHLQIDQHGNHKLATPESSQTWANKNISQHADGSFDITAGENLSINVDGGKITIYGAGDIDFVSGANVNITAANKINLNAAHSVNVRGSRIGIQSTDDNIDIYSDQKIKINSGADMSIKSGSSIFIETPDVNVSSNTTKLTSSGQTHINSSTTFIDDIVRLAQGGAESATKSNDNAVVQDTASMPEPSTQRIIAGVSSKGGAGAYNRATVDDVEGDIVTDVVFDADGFEKGVEISCRLQQDGYSKAAAAAIVGNAMHESAQFKADTEYGGGGGRGWLQWTGPRRTNFENWSASQGLEPTSDNANYGFMIYELAGGTGSQWTGGASTKEFNSITDPIEATTYFMNNYERPAAATAALSKRQAYARDIYNSTCPEEGVLI